VAQDNQEYSSETIKSITTNTDIGRLDKLILDKADAYRGRKMTVTQAKIKFVKSYGSPCCQFILERLSLPKSGEKEAALSRPQNPFMDPLVLTINQEELSLSNLTASMPTSPQAAPAPSVPEKEKGIFSLFSKKPPQPSVTATPALPVPNAGGKWSMHLLREYYYANNDFFALEKRLGASQNTFLSPLKSTVAMNTPHTPATPSYSSSSSRSSASGSSSSSPSVSSPSTPMISPDFCYDCCIKEKQRAKSTKKEVPMMNGQSIDIHINMQKMTLYPQSTSDSYQILRALATYYGHIQNQLDSLKGGEITKKGRKVRFLHIARQRP
jgi:hypothetical protein